MSLATGPKADFMILRLFASEPFRLCGPAGGGGGGKRGSFPTSGRQACVSVQPHSRERRACLTRLRPGSEWLKARRSLCVGKKAQEPRLTRDPCVLEWEGTMEFHPCSMQESELKWPHWLDGCLTFTCLLKTGSITLGNFGDGQPTPLKNNKLKGTK